MKEYRKTFIGSIVAFFVGTSCCWLSSLAIWFGGVTFIAVLTKWVEDFQMLFILLSVLLAIISVYLYRKRKIRS